MSRGVAGAEVSIQGQQGGSGREDVGLDFDQEGVYCRHNNGSSRAGSSPVCQAGGKQEPQGP